MPKSGREDSPAKTSASQESAPVLMANEVSSLFHSSTLWSDVDLGGWCWKTSLDSSLPLGVVTSEDSSMKWTSSGTLSRGELLMLDISESPSDAVECSLSQVLSKTAPHRFSLSAKATAGILERARKRGKKLPAELQAALESGELSTRRLTPTECEILMGWPPGWTISNWWKTRPRPKRTRKG